jgi:rRNA maturation endonuclease Nob1
MLNYPHNLVLMPTREPRTTEAYQLRCWQCFTDQELPANRERFHCYRCGARLQIEWYQSRKAV